MPAINLYNLSLEDFRGAHLSPEGFGDQIAGQGYTGNGVSKPLSGYFSTLADAIAAFPLVSGLALTDELDYAASSQLVAQMGQAPPAGVHPQIGGVVELHHKGLYVVNKPLIAATGVNLQGGGRQTVMSRSQDLPAGHGLLDIPGGSVGTSFSDMLIEGNVLTPVGVNYSAFGGPGGDPFYGQLTLNSSVWVHGASGADTTDISFTDCTFQHTGGYSCILDARSGNIKRVKFTRCTFINNRPHLFGLTNGDLNYGAWTGGVLYANDGINFCLSDISFENCHFIRCNGNGIWGHSTSLALQNNNVTFINCTFEDIGLSACQMGNVTGGGAQDCTFHRIGYTTLSDSAAPVPAYCSNAGINLGAVAIDTAGYASNINHTGNKARSINGDAFVDMDGLRSSSVKDNDASIPTSTDPDYETDSVPAYGPGQNGVNSTAGINAGNTNQNGGAQNLNIAGNHLSNFGACAIALYYLKYSTVSDNTIVHPSTATAPPMELGSVTGATLGAGPDEFYNYANVIRNNHIDYSGENWCIAEVGNGWQPGQANTYFGNVCTGANYGEVQINASASSSVNQVYSTSSPGAAIGSENMVQREGYGPTASLKTYMRVASNSVNGVVKTATQLQQLADVGPHLNVSTNGTTNTGAFSTGSLPTVGFFDFVSSKRHLSGGGFIGLEYSGTLDTAADSLDPANANPGNWIVLRNNAGTLEYSNSTGAGGVRIYHNLISGGGGGSASSGMANFVQLSDGMGGFISSANFVFDPSLQKLTVAGVAGTPAILVSAGFFQGLFYSASTGYESMHTLGGVHAVNGVTVDQAVYMNEIAAPNPPGMGPGVLYGGMAYKGGSQYWYWNTTANAWGLVDFQSVGMAGVSMITGTANQIAVTPSSGTGAVTLALTPLVDTISFNCDQTGGYQANGGVVIDGNHNAFLGTLTMSNAASSPALGGINAVTVVVGSPQGNALWLPNGGITAQFGTFNYNDAGASTTVQIPNGGITAKTAVFANNALPTLTVNSDGLASSGGFGSVQIMRATGANGAHIAMIRQDGFYMGLGFGQYVNKFGFGTGFGTAGVAGAFQPNLLSIDMANSGNLSSPGFGSFAGGVSTNYGSLGLGSGAFVLNPLTAAPGVSTGAVMYFDNATGSATKGHLLLSEAGGPFLPISGGGGVASIGGITGAVVLGTGIHSTGNTIYIGQEVLSTSNVTFNQIFSAVSGTGTAIQAGGGNFTVTGSGNVSAAGTADFAVGFHSSSTALNVVNVIGGGVDALLYNCRGTVFNSIQLAQGGGVSFGSSIGEKIVLYDGGVGNRYGIGIQSSLLEIYGGPGSAVQIGQQNNSVFSAGLTLTTALNVGIGTASPSAKLEVSSTGALVMRLIGSLGTGSNNNQLRFYGGGAAADLWVLGTDVSSGNGSQYFQFYDIAGIVPIALQKGTGRVGFGSSNPANQVTVIPAVLGSSITLATANQIGIGEATDNALYRLVLGYSYLNSVWTGVIQTTAGVAAGTANSGGPLALNPTGGNVGIGMQAPGTQLHLVGAAGTSAPGSSNLGCTLYLQDNGGAPSNGGQILFGASQGFWAGIKGLITGGGGNTVGSLCLYVRITQSDASLSPALLLGTTSGTTSTYTMVYGPITSVSTASPPSGLPAYGALQHNSGPVWNYWTGSAWGTVNLAAVGGVISVSNGTGVFVNQTTGAVVVSIGQDVSTSASVSFNSIGCNVFSCNATVTCNLVNTNGVNSNGTIVAGGNITSNSGSFNANSNGNYQIGAVTVISSGRDGFFHSITFDGNNASIGATGTGTFTTIQIASNTVIDVNRIGYLAGLSFGTGMGNGVGLSGNGIVQAGGYNVGGTPVINSSGQFVGAGVNVGTNGIAGGALTINISGVGGLAAVTPSGGFQTYGSISGIPGGTGSGVGVYAGFSGFVYCTDSAPDKRLMRFLNGLLIGIS